MECRFAAVISNGPRRPGGVLAADSTGALDNAPTWPFSSKGDRSVDMGGVAGVAGVQAEVALTLCSHEQDR
jgi:hypothetical protein